jgi:16S rRNA G966 N2-methylase RsmD
VLVLFELIYWLFVPIISAPFYASSSQDILKMFELANLGQKDVVIDLGSGDGRVALAASRIAKQAVGIEINPFLTIISRFMALISTNGRVKFINNNFWKENLARYDVIFMYLSPGQNAKLRKKFEKELAPGTKIVTNSFKIKGWKAKKQLDDRYYLYVIGKHK